MRYYLFLVAVAILFSFSVAVFAQEPTVSIAIPNPLGSEITTLPALLAKVIQYALVIATPILTFMILWGGFQMLMAKDNAAKFKKGLDTVKNAAFGAAVVLVSSGVIYVIQDILKP